MSEAEIAANFEAALEKVRQGLEVIVEHEHQPIAVLRAAEPPRRKISECIAMLSADSTATIDADFAADVEAAIAAHRESLGPPAMGLILNSSAAVAAERQGMNAKQLLLSIRAQTGDDDVAVSVITLLELAHGIVRSDTPQRHEKRQRFLEEPMSVLPPHGITAAVALPGRPDRWPQPSRKVYASRYQNRFQGISIRPRQQSYLHIADCERSSSCLRRDYGISTDKSACRCRLYASSRLWLGRPVQPLSPFRQQFRSPDDSPVLEKEHPYRMETRIVEHNTRRRDRELQGRGSDCGHSGGGCQHPEYRALRARPAGEPAQYAVPDLLTQRKRGQSCNPLSLLLS